MGVYMDFIDTNYDINNDMSYTLTQFKYYFGFDAQEYNIIDANYGIFDPNKLLEYRQAYYEFYSISSSKANNNFKKKYGFNITNYDGSKNNIAKNHRIVNLNSYGFFSNNMIDTYKEFIADLENEFDDVNTRERQFLYYFGIPMNFNLINGIGDVENIIYYKFNKIKSISQLLNNY